MKLARYRSARTGPSGSGSSPRSWSRRIALRRGPSRVRRRSWPAAMARPAVPDAAGEPEPLDRVAAAGADARPAVDPRLLRLRGPRGHRPPQPRPGDGARLVRAAGLLLHEPGGRPRTTATRCRYLPAPRSSTTSWRWRRSSAWSAPTSTPTTGSTSVAGFTIMNDWSARDLQRREMALGLGPAKGKDFATIARPGPGHPRRAARRGRARRAATMVARVNGEEWSRGELADLHFGWGQLLAHASRGHAAAPGRRDRFGTVGTGCILELGLVHGRERYPWLTSGDAGGAGGRGHRRARQPYRLTAARGKARPHGLDTGDTHTRRPSRSRSKRSSTSWPRRRRPRSRSAWPNVTPKASTSRARGFGGQSWRADC